MNGLAEQAVRRLHELTAGLQVLQHCFATSSSRDLGKNDAQWAAYAFTETRHDLALAR